MNKIKFENKYKEFCKEFGLEVNEAVISAGGVLLMVGLRSNTEDLDLDIPVKLYDSLVGNGIGELVKSPMGEYIVIAAYSLHRGVNKNIKTEVFDGVCCYSLEEVLRQKENIRRPEGDVKVIQDKKDIEGLKKLLGK